MGIIMALIMCKVTSILPALTDKFEMSAAMASWLMSIFTLVGVIASVPIGKLVVRFGPKRIIVAAAGVAVLGAIGGILAPNGPALIASRLVEGIAMTMTAVCGPGIIKLCVDPSRQGAALGIWSVWFSLGVVLAGVATPLIFEAYGYETAWIIYALFAVAGALAIQFLIRVPNSSTTVATEADQEIATKQALPEPILVETPATESTVLEAVTEATTPDRASVTGPTAAEASSVNVKPGYRELFIPNILLYLLSFCIYCITTTAFISYVPSILQIRGYDATISGFISTVPSLVSIISSLILGAVSDKYHNFRLLVGIPMVILAVTAAGMFVLTGVPLWINAVICGLFGGGVAGVVIVAYLSLLPRPQLVPLALGAIVSIQGIGQFLATLVTQPLLGPDLTNWNLAGTVILILGLVGAVASIICRYPKVQPEDCPPTDRPEKSKEEKKC
jgi:MFS family permease